MNRFGPILARAVMSGIALTVALVALAGCTQSHINSVNTFRDYTIGNWCFYYPPSGIDYKIVLDRSDTYILYNKHGETFAGWQLLQKGQVIYGKGKYHLGKNEYYFMHLNNTGINIGVNRGIELPDIRKSLPVWFVDQHGTFKTVQATNNCHI